jgi:hypothetical protein
MKQEQNRMSARKYFDELTTNLDAKRGVMSNQVLVVQSNLMVHMRPNLMLIHPAHDVTRARRVSWGTT